MPDTFSESPDGILYCVNGQDRPSTWNGLDAQFRDSGVDAPSGTPAMSSAAPAGNIHGRFYCAVRFVDDLGNYSNISTISDVHEPSVWERTITNVTFEAPIKISTSPKNHLLATGDTVFIKDVGGCVSANGIWTVTVVDGTSFTLDDSAANGNWTGGGTVVRGAATLTYSSLPVPTQSKVVRRQILRNKDGNAKVFYVDIDTTDLSSTTLTSTKTSDDLDTPVALEDINGIDNAVSLYTPMTAIKSHIVHYKGRFFGMGDEDYDEGCVAVTNGSTSVTGIATRFKENHEGRIFRVPGSDETYEIDTVSSNTALTLTTPYAGAADQFTPYVIQLDDEENATITWTESGLPEASPPSNQRVIQKDPGAGRVTGGFTMSGFLYITSEHRIYRLSYARDPIYDANIPLALSRGCINKKCAVVVDGVAFLLDSLGVHAFSGSDDIPTVGAHLQDLFRNNPISTLRVNWTQKRWFHAALDPNENVIRWWVCLDGHQKPHHALCLHYQTGRCWIEQWPFPITSSCTGRLNGRPHVFVGSRLGRILALESGALDGPQTNAGTVRGTVTTSGPNWIADSSATFPSSGVVGFPVVITGGRGKGQSRLVTTVSGTRLNVGLPWVETPDSTSTYQLGGIQWNWQSLWYPYAEGTYQELRGVSIQAKATPSQSQLDARIYEDFSTDPLEWEITTTSSERDGVSTVADKPDIQLDTTKSTGHFRQAMNGGKLMSSDGPRFVSVELRGTTNDARHQISRVKVDGVG